LIGGVVPGSILTILLVSVMQGGFRAGRRAFLWSLAAELTVVSLLLLILLSLPLSMTVFHYIGLVGGLVLFYFAWQVMHLSRIEKPGGSGEVFSGKKIYILAATNAPLYIFWVTVCAPLIWQLGEIFPLYIAALFFMIAFEIGWAASTFVVMLIFVKSRTLLTNPQIMGKVYMVVALFLALFGMRMWYAALHDLHVL
jgi:threonine/homoserine/homoserine lactone efflux protein